MSSHATLQRHFVPEAVLNPKLKQSGAEVPVPPAGFGLAAGTGRMPLSAAALPALRKLHQQHARSEAKIRRLRYDVERAARNVRVAQEDAKATARRSVSSALLERRKRSHEETRMLDAGQRLVDRAESIRPRCSATANFWALSSLRTWYNAATQPASLAEAGEVLAGKGQPTSAATSVACRVGSHTSQGRSARRLGQYAFPPQVDVTQQGAWGATSPVGGQVHSTQAYMVDVPAWEYTWRAKQAHNRTAKAALRINQPSTSVAVQGPPRLPSDPQPIGDNSHVFDAQFPQQLSATARDRAAHTLHAVQQLPGAGERLVAQTPQPHWSQWEMT